MIGAVINTEATEDMLKLNQAVPAALPPEATQAIEDAGYNAEMVIDQDLEIDLEAGGTEFGERRHQVTTTDLINNPLWIESAKELIPLFRTEKSTPTSRYAQKYFGAGEEEGEEYNEEHITDLEAAQWGLELMGQFNWDLSKMIKMVWQMQDSSPRERYALYNLMQSYDKLPNFTFDGSMRMLKGLASDISSYIGLTTVGAGFLARYSAKQAGKTGLKNYLKATMPAGVVAGIEGGAFTSLDDAMRQTVAMRADQQDEFSLGQNLASTGIGVAAGTTLGVGGPKAAELAVKGVKAGLETFRNGFDNMVANAQSGTLTMGVGPTGGKATAKPNLDQADLDILEANGIDVDKIEAITDERLRGGFEDDALLEAQFGVNRSLKNPDDRPFMPTQEQILANRERKDVKRHLDEMTREKLEEAVGSISKRKNVAAIRERGEELFREYRELIFIDDPDQISYAELAKRYPDKPELLKAAKRIDDNMRQAIADTLSGKVSKPSNITKKIDVQDRELRQRKRVQLSGEERGKIEELSAKKTIPAKTSRQSSGV